MAYSHACSAKFVEPIRLDISKASESVVPWDDCADLAISNRIQNMTFTERLSKRRRRSLQR